LQQQEEIDHLNKKYTDFHIFKGIESDILNDGSLDYPDEILKRFDFIVASVHSNLKMQEDKATARLIKAIENPYTTI
jgi:DNA polymerase (family 10)